MTDERHNMDEWLLDGQLDQLTESQRRELMEALRKSPALADRNRRLQRLLEPLDAFTTTPPPTYLVDKVLDRIAAQDESLPVVPESALMSGSDGDYSRRSVFSFKEMLTLAAMLTFVMLIVVPGVASMRAKSRQVACANNLHQIGRGVLAYAAANTNALPAVASAPSQGAWLRETTGVKPYTPNSRSRYLLLRLGYVDDGSVFICPSQSGAKVLAIANPHAFSDFPDPANCSYDSQNMAGPTAKLSAGCDVPFMADANPLFEGGKFHAVDPLLTNSRNHNGGRGQNVLYLAGHAKWTKNPNCGVRGDNIWQAGTLRHYRGTEKQTCAEDAFLVP